MKIPGGQVTSHTEISENKMSALWNRVTVKKLVTILLLVSFSTSCGNGGGGGSTPDPVQSGTSPNPATGVNDPPGESMVTAESVNGQLRGLPLLEFMDVSFLIIVRRYLESLISNGVADLFAPDFLGLNNVSDEYQRGTLIPGADVK